MICCWDLFLALVSAAGEIVVTPNTVTEASNLLRQIGDPARTHIGDMLRRFLLNAREDYVASRKAAESAVYLRLGITDAAMLHEDFAQHVLLTADPDLYLEAARQGREAINFFHHIEANT